jgi:anti-anti-sigma factor
MANIAFRVKNIKSADGTFATLAEMDGSIDASTIKQFQQVMDKLVERGVKNLILDCTNIKYINSTGLGTLLKYADTFEGMSGHIAFCRVPSKVMLVMEMLGFNALFNIVPDEATALRAFSGKIAPPSSVKVETTPTRPTAQAQPAPMRQSSPAMQPVAPVQIPIQREVPAPPPVATFPLQTPCARCRVTLEVANAGKFKCPRCASVLAVEPSGRVRYFASKKSQPVRLIIPCSRELLPGMAALARQCALTVGFPEDAAHGVGEAIRLTCENIIERSFQNNVSQVFHALICPNGAALTVKFSDHGRPLDFSGGGIHADPGFAPVIELMDTVEHRPHPKGGNLLTLIKLVDQA